MAPPLIKLYDCLKTIFERLVYSLESQNAVNVIISGIRFYSESKNRVIFEAHISINSVTQMVTDQSFILTCTVK